MSFLDDVCRAECEAFCSELEARILAGCSRCGRRLLDGEQFINEPRLLNTKILGAEPKIDDYKPICGECFDELWTWTT